MGSGYPGYRGQGGSGYPQHRQYADPPRGPLTTTPAGTAQQPAAAADGQELAAPQTRPAHADNRKALLHAAAFGDLADVQALLKQGANPDARAKDRTGRTALILAAAGGHVEIVKALLASGATVDDRDRTGHTALNWAAMRGRTQVATALLGQGRRYQYEGQWRRLALAVRSGYSQCRHGPATCG